MRKKCGGGGWRETGDKRDGVPGRCRRRRFPSVISARQTNSPGRIHRSAQVDAETAGVHLFVPVVEAKLEKRRHVATTTRGNERGNVTSISFY